MSLWHINLSKDFVIFGEKYYQWDASHDVALLEIAHEYGYSCAGFYTNYIDVDGITRIQRTYDRKHIAAGVYPLGCMIVRTNLAKFCGLDPDCGDYACFDLWLKLTEVGAFAHLPLTCFKELAKKQYNTDKNIVFQKALAWKS